MSIKNPLKRILPFFGAIAVFLISFGAVAHAAGAVEPADGSLLDLLQPVLAAFRDGSYIYAGSLALVVAVAIARRYGEPKYPWLATDAGSALLAFIGAFGGSMATRTVGGIDWDWSMAWSSLEIAVGAAGGYSVIKALLIKPYVLNLAGKGPEWMHWPLHLILWIFQESDVPPTPAQQAVAAVTAINRADSDIVVSVTTPMGSAVASSPAVAPAAPISVITDVGVAVPRTMTPLVIVAPPDKPEPPKGS